MTISDAPRRPAPHRNYVKRKRYLNESVDLVKKTLECLASLRHEVPNPGEISRQAVDRAKEIEAACWTSLRRPSNEDYNKEMMGKTRQVCLALIRDAVGPGSLAPYLHLLATRPQRSAGPPQVNIPIPNPRVPAFSPPVGRPEVPQDLSSHYDPLSLDLSRDSGLGNLQMFDSGQAPFFKFEMDLESLSRDSE
jgi:hypothetical protein